MYFISSHPKDIVMKLVYMTEQSRLVTPIIAPNSVLQHAGVVLQATLDPPSHTHTKKQKYYSKIIFAGESDRNITLASVSHFTSFTLQTYNANKHITLTMVAVFI